VTGVLDQVSEPVLCEHNGFVVVRDDLLVGGTKRRVLPALFDEIGASEVVYPSPAPGYAQVALAHVGAALGVRVTIFVAQRNVKHPRTQEAIAAGAKMIEVPVGYMTVLRARARTYCAVSGAVLLPFGLDLPVVRAGLADVARRLPVNPTEVWVAAGSGVLSRSLQAAWPTAACRAVRVGAVPNVGRADLYRARERFEVDAREPPPFPSCSNYDAKVWHFIVRHASPGALFWNVAA
jgi:hypothetical protein